LVIPDAHSLAALTTRFVVSESTKTRLFRFLDDWLVKPAKLGHQETVSRQVNRELRRRIPPGCGAQPTGTLAGGMDDGRGGGK